MCVYVFCTARTAQATYGVVVSVDDKTVLFLALLSISFVATVIVWEPQYPHRLLVLLTNEEFRGLQRREGGRDGGREVATAHI